MASNSVTQQQANSTSADAAISPAGDTEEYFMRHIDRGYAVIISNTHFRNSASDRNGSDKDAERMEKLFLTLGFLKDNIRILKDATKMDIMSCMTEAAARDYTNCDCFVCVILSHGNEDVILSSDNKNVQIYQIVAQMRRGKCPSLAGKPKMFFIQACNGHGLDLGVTLPQPRSNNQSDAQSDDIGKEEPAKSEPDFLIAHSSVPGYYAWFQPGQGSLFILCLVKVIEKNWTQQDLLSMLTEVNCTVAEDTEFRMQGLKQMPFFQSLLTKKVFFPTQ